MCFASRTSFVVPSESRDLGSSLARENPDSSSPFVPRNDKRDVVRPAICGPLLIPLLPLALWYAFHYVRTGFVFGNPEFFRYNVQATVQPLRVLLALGLRLWQVVGYLNLYLLTLAALFAMWLPPLRENGEDRKRISAGSAVCFPGGQSRPTCSPWP